VNRILAALMSLLLIATTSLPQIATAAPDDLPDIGSPAQTTISQEDEYRIGRMIVRGLQDSDRILQDPEVTEYIQSLGHQLSSQAPDGNRRFEFFVVKDSTINAFALPGGFVGVNTGLLLATKNEAELAAVLAHEISHVTQRHIARSISAQSKSSIVSTAAMLAAILIGAAVGGGDAAMAGIAAAQTVALQQQVAFTRGNEAEADRVGIGLMAQAGFDPNAMPAFFETMGRMTGLGEDRVPEIVRSHPVTSERIAESKARAAQMHDLEIMPASIGYGLARERIRVLTTPAGQDAYPYYAALGSTDPDITNADRYGKALALVADHRASEAIPILQRLRDANQTVVLYHTGLGQAQLEAGQAQKSLATLTRAHDLFPRNLPVTVRYAETLLRIGEARKAHEVLLDLFNNVPPTPEQARFIAMVANSAGDVADAYSYMAEYHIMGGDLPLAINQLQLALSVPKITEVQRQRFKARLEELQRAMPRRAITRPVSTGG
jgi:predicted Zn-dependent protease